MERRILLKPHHFLDILKLYGFGLEFFVPDKDHEHDFHRVGNIILKNPLVVIQLTTGADDVCKPCCFLKDRECIDKIQNFAFPSKQKWNKIIDKRILCKLSLKNGDKMTAIELCRLTKKKLTDNDIASIWKERPINKTKKRIKHLMTGIKKYSQKYSNFKL